VYQDNDRKPKEYFQRDARPPFRLDEKVAGIIKDAEEHFKCSILPYTIEELNPFQRKQMHRYFERAQEYKVRTLRDQNDQVLLKIYHAGELQRMAEIKVQEVLMSGEPCALPTMDSYERFIIHDYMKERGGIKTESIGGDNERHVVIYPVFGRTPKKAKRRLT
jgi:predicted RNA-binding protein Jag